MTRRGWTAWERGFVLENQDMTLDEMAEELGRTVAAVKSIRADLRHGWEPVREFGEKWTSAEDAIIIANPYMSGPSLGKLLQRSRESVVKRRNILRTNGHTLPRAQNDSPFTPGARPVLAKTCPDCGLLLQAKWFYIVNGAWRRRCIRCHSQFYESSRPARSPLEQRRRSKEHFARYQAATVRQASNNGNPWTEADSKILADPDLTLLEKAFVLKRTYASVTQRAQKNGFISKVGIGDPERDQWIIDNPNAKEYTA